MQGLISLLPMLLIFGGMIFFMNRSQKKKQKKEEEQRNAVQVGDEIVTIGGFVFRVISVKDDHYIVE
ncbi:MAG: preprotein translocase subunit YajC, partial [Clostridia bacterium]|nr:preprotein translocase subunit YajC [Clostridia bacterium]